MELTDELKDFGRQLIETEDLDPVYSALWRAKLPESQLCRWLTAYMMFYHVGSASYLSEFAGNTYWEACLKAARNEEPAPPGGRWPRSSERRHFRGQKCVNAVLSMGNRTGGEPEQLWRSLRDLRTEVDVIRWVKKGWPMHGDWAGFKAADLAERVCGYPVRFNESLGIMYEAPRSALDLLIEEVDTTPDDHRHLVYANLMIWVRQFSAPPGRDRPCGPQELETVLCKWGSMRSGHYHVGKDTKEIRLALQEWAPHSQTAKKLLNRVPGVPG